MKTGGMRRACTWRRSRQIVAKRVVCLQAAAFNLALISAIHSQKPETPQRPADLKKEGIVLALLRVSRRSLGHYLRLFSGSNKQFTDQIFPFRQSAAEFRPKLLAPPEKARF